MTGEEVKIINSPVTCPVCHQEVRVSDYYCFNCGKNLRPAPLPTAGQQQISLYLKSFLLPPYGLIIGMRYWRQNDTGSRRIAIISVVLTLISLLIAVKATRDLVETINKQVNEQIGILGY